MAVHASKLVVAGLLELALPECERGIGNVISSPDSPDLIEGVRIEPFSLWPDDRGYFLEVQRMGQGLAAAFPAASTQASAALNYPGIIKAFHYHLQQNDCWTPARGMLQVALVDLRAGSGTFGARNTMYVGALRPWRILIPPGVAHGYKVIGAGPANLNYDWETQHK